MARAVLYTRVYKPGEAGHRQRVPASRRGVPLGPGQGLWKGVVVPSSGYWARIVNDYLPLSDDYHRALDQLHEINTALRHGRPPEEIMRRAGQIVEGRLATEITEFLESKNNPVHASRKIAPSTAASYSITLKDFAAFCQRRGVESVLGIDRQLVLDYLSLRKSSIGPRMLSRVFWQVRAFLLYFKQDIMRKGDSPRADAGDPVEYSDEELSKLFASRRGNELLWKFFAYTGMRKSEVAHLEWRDLELEEGVVVVRSHPFRGQYVKTRQSRQIPLHEELIRALARLRESRNPGPRDLVFPNQFGGVDRSMSYKLFRDAAANSIECAKLHRFRYTFASRCIINAGVDPVTVMRWLGHTTLNTTLRYYIAVRDASSKRHRLAIAQAFNSVDSHSTHSEPFVSAQ